jgi:hypothetical protein
MKPLYNDLQQYLIDAEYTTDRDCEVKKQVSGFFRNAGWTVYNTTQFCHFDLLIVKGNQEYLIEVKKRYCDSTLYADNTCEVAKKEELEKLAPLNQSILVSVYLDNVLRMSRFDWASHTAEKRANKQTYFSDKRKVNKNLILFDKYIDYKL